MADTITSSNLTNRERVQKVLNHKQTDIIPFDIEFTEPARAKMAEYYHDDSFTGKLGNCFLFADFDGFDLCKEVEPNIYEDWFGARWDRSVDKDIGTVVNRQITIDTFSQFRFPDPNSKELYAEKREKILAAQDKIIIGNVGFSLFERAWILMGMEELFIAMIHNKSFVHQLLDKILEYNLSVLKNICDMEIDGVRFGDDWGDQRGIIMGPDLWREFIKPRVRRMYEYVKSKGKFVLIHSCGKVQELLPDFIEVGVDVFNPFQPEVMDVFEIKKEYGTDLSFYGGISIQKTLPFGSVQDVKDEIQMLLDRIGKDGGYIASPSHDIPGDAKADNIAAMIEVLQNQ